MLVSSGSCWSVTILEISGEYACVSLVCPCHLPLYITDIGYDQDTMVVRYLHCDACCADSCGVMHILSTTNLVMLYNLFVPGVIINNLLARDESILFLGFFAFVKGYFFSL